MGWLDVDSFAVELSKNRWGSVFVGAGFVSPALWGGPSGGAVGVEGDLVVVVFAVVVPGAEASEVGGGGCAGGPGGDVVEFLDGVGAAGGGAGAAGGGFGEFPGVGVRAVLVAAHRLRVVVFVEEKAAPGAVHGEV